MRPAAIIYDHDGTLVDSLAVVVAATNATLVARGFSERPAPEIIKGMAHPTIPRLALHAGIADARLLATMADEFYAHMHALPHLCRVYAGVPEVLAAVAGRGLPQGLVSNNSGRFVRLALTHLGLVDHFRSILGEENVPAPKPDARGALLAAQECGVDPTACWFVGDSPADREAARGAGMRSIGVTWGIHDQDEMAAMGFDQLIDHPRQLLDLLG